MRHTVASQFARDYLFRNPTRLEQSLEKPFGGFAISTLLQININHLAILINSSPEIVLFAVDLHEYLIQKISIAKSRVPPPKASGKFGTKLVNPEPNGFIADIDVAFNQKILHIPDTEILSSTWSKSR